MQFLQANVSRHIFNTTEAPVPDFGMSDPGSAVADFDFLDEHPAPETAPAPIFDYPQSKPAPVWKDPWLIESTNESTPDNRQEPDRSIWSLNADTHPINTMVNSFDDNWAGGWADHC